MGGRETPLLAREVFPFPPSPPSLPQRAFSGGTRTFNLFNWKIALERFTFEKGETRGGSTAPPHRKWADKPQLSRPPIFRLHCRPARSPLPPLAADAAMARARRRSRTHEGRTERRRPAHHAAGGVQPDSGDKFRVPAQRGVRGCRGCRGATAPLTPCPAPGRRPAAHAGQKPRCTERHRLNTTRTFYLFQS